MCNIQSDVGKTIKIKRFLKQEKKYGGKRVNVDMVTFRGKKAKITEVILPGKVDNELKSMGFEDGDEIFVEDFPMYHIDLDEGQYYWTKKMFRFGKWILKESDKR